MGESKTLEIDGFYSLQEDLVQGWYVSLEDDEIDVFTYRAIGSQEEDSLRLPREHFPGWAYKFDSFNEPSLFVPFHPMFALFYNPSELGNRNPFYD